MIEARDCLQTRPRADVQFKPACPRREEHMKEALQLGIPFVSDAFSEPVSKSGERSCPVRTDGGLESFEGVVELLHSGLMLLSRSNVALLAESMVDGSSRSSRSTAVSSKSEWNWL